MKAVLLSIFVAFIHQCCNRLVKIEVSAYLDPSDLDLDDPLSIYAIPEEF